MMVRGLGSPVRLVVSAPASPQRLGLATGFLRRSGLRRAAPTESLKPFSRESFMFHRLVGVGRRILRYLTSALAIQRVRRHSRRLLLEPLAARQVLASYPTSGGSATLTLDGSSENLSITADPTNYLITTSLSGWSGAATPGVVVSGTTLQLAKATFTGTISIVDQTGINGGSVTFTNNATPAYDANFTVTLNDSPGAVTFATNANPSFGTRNLTVTTTGSSSNIVFQNGATVAATSGSVTLNAGGAVPLNPTSGVSTTSGDLSLGAGGAVTLNSSASVATGSGALSLNAGTAISFASSSASVASTSGAVTLNAVTTGAATVDSTADVSGGAVSITALSQNSIKTAETTVRLTVTTGTIKVA